MAARTSEGLPDRVMTDADRARSGFAIVALALLLVLTALQRGGYYAESWGLPTAACGWTVAVLLLIGSVQRPSRLEWAQYGALSLLTLFTLGSAFWTSGGLGSTLPPAQLLALFVAALVALGLVFQRGTMLVVTLGASLLLITLVALGTHLFPSSAVADAYGGARLAQPIGYWNGLGLWAAMGLVLSVALAARGRPLTLRAAAAASCVPFSAALYLTFSRGALIALGAGLIAALALDPRRVGLMAWLILLAPFPALAVVLAARSHGLTRIDASFAQTREDGRSLAVGLVVLSAAAALQMLGAAHLQRRWAIPKSVRWAFAATVMTLAVIAVGGVMVRFGTPSTLTTKVVHQFDSGGHDAGGNLNARLLDISSDGRNDLWRVAWRDAERHPYVGSGAGSYKTEWIRNRANGFDASNAHSLYLETLAELGAVGLGLLVVALGVPLVAAWKAREHPLAAGAFAAYVAFLVHMAGDWGWQLAAVALAGLSCGAALLVMARPAHSPAIRGPGRWWLWIAGNVVALFALWSLYGSYPLGQARDAAHDGQWRIAERHAADAVQRFGGFSSTPWLLLGEAQTALHEREAARASLRVAIKRDPTSWQAWYDLAVVARGPERRMATREVFELNPIRGDVPPPTYTNGP